MVAKIKIKNLCNRIKNNIDEKTLFFKEVSASEFLVPFYEENVFDFTDMSSYWTLRYLNKVYLGNGKIIVDILNKCISLTNNINDIPHNTYFQIIEIIKQMSLKDIERINERLFEHDSAIYLVKVILAKPLGLENINLYLKFLSPIFKYKIINDVFHGDEYVIDYDVYPLSELVTNEKLIEKFKDILSQNEIFNKILNEYNKLNKKIYKNVDVNIKYYYIKRLDEIEHEIEYCTNNLKILDLLQYLIYLSCNNNDNTNYKKLNKLIISNDIALQQIALTCILTYQNEYYSLFEKILVNKTSVNLTKLCLLEFVRIFQSKHIWNKEEVDIINKYLRNIKKSSKRLQYEVLHGLKDYKEFEELFLELKSEYKYENSNPGVYRESVGGWVESISPISKNEFEKLTISEQIAYINSDIIYNKELKQISKDNVQEENELGLIKVFKSVVSENLFTYTKDETILQISKDSFIIAFLEVITLEIKKISNFRLIIKFINKVLQIRGYTNYGIIYAIINFNHKFVINNKDIKAIFKLIKNISENCIDGDFINSDEYDVKALNNLLGRNSNVFIKYIQNKKDSLNNDELKIFNKLLTEEKFSSIYYYLGTDYELLIDKFSNSEINLYMSKMTNEQKRYFIEGYISYFRDISILEKVQDIVVEAFKANFIQRDKRRRFVQILIDAYFRYDNIGKELYCTFEKFFTEDDFHNILHRIAYAETNRYDKEKVLTYLKNECIDNICQSNLLIIDIFNKYGNSIVINEYKDLLRKFFKTKSGNNTTTFNSVSSFLKILCEYLKESNDYIFVYEILKDIICYLEDYIYLDKEMTEIKLILDYFVCIGKQENASIISKHIYKSSSNIKLYSNMFTEYMNI